MKKRLRKRIIALVIVAGVVILPLAYSIFYLGAFWDPYGKLDKLPVALVNEDKGAEIDGSARNLGRELVDRLIDDASLGWSVTDADDARDGLASGRYYAAVTVPASFSADVASAQTANKTEARLLYSANEKANFLAAQILNRALLELEESVRSDIDKELTNSLTDKLKEVPSGLEDIRSALAQLSEGANELQNGFVGLQNGQGSMGDGLDRLNGGIGKLQTGAKELEKNLLALRDGVAGLRTAFGMVKNAMPASLFSSRNGLPALVKGIDGADEGAKKLSSGVSEYVQGVDALIAGNGALYQTLQSIYASAQLTDAQKVAAVGALLQSALTPENAAKLTALSAAGAQLDKGAASLAAGTGRLKQADAALAELGDALTSLEQVSEKLNAATEGKSGATMAENLDYLALSLEKLENGALKLAGGAQELVKGLADAKSGAQKLASGDGELSDGTAKLSEGLTKLGAGIKTADAGVRDAIGEAKTGLQSTEGLGEFAAHPVKVVSEAVNPVPNYGTAFAPYFLSLSLYVGALIMFVGIYLDADEKLPSLARHSAHRYRRQGVFALIGAAQAVILALLVRYGLRLTVNHAAAYYLSCVLISFVFISIVEFFMVCLQDTGKFLSLLLLILQLTSCGGTFPMEVVPGFFNALYPFMPMTYAVKLFKEAISGTGGVSYVGPVLVLVGIGAAFTLLTALWQRASLEKKKAEEVVPAGSR